MRDKCKVDGCGCHVDMWKDASGKEHFRSFCQKHRKTQPRQRRVLDDTPVKKQIEYKDGVPLCMVEGCHRLAIKRSNGKRSSVCGYHGRSHHQHQERLKRRVDNSRLRKYGINKEEYNSLMESQGGMCAICHSEPATAIDHNHKTGEVRELLCTKCNAGIGQFKENIQYMLSAIEYIKKHSNTK